VIPLAGVVTALLSALETRKGIIAVYENSSRLRSSDESSWRLTCISSWLIHAGRREDDRERANKSDWDSENRLMMGPKEDFAWRPLYSDRTSKRNKINTTAPLKIFFWQERKEKILYSAPFLQSSLLIHSVLHMPLEPLEVKHLGGV
jgi:hypothetical protein